MKCFVFGSLLHEKFKCTLPYISLCKIMFTLKEPLLAGFYFYVQNLQTMSQGCCLTNITVFGMKVHKKIF